MNSREQFLKNLKEKKHAEESAKQNVIAENAAAKAKKSATNKKRTAEKLASLSTAPKKAKKTVEVEMNDKVVIEETPVAKLKNVVEIKKAKKAKAPAKKRGRPAKK